MPHRDLRNALLLALLLLVIGTLAYTHLEAWTPVQAFYFSAITLTTVGYGDLYPTSDASRLFTACYALIGIAVSLYALSSLGAHVVHRTHLHHAQGARPSRRRA